MQFMYARLVYHIIYIHYLRTRPPPLSQFSMYLFISSSGTTHRECHFKLYDFHYSPESERRYFKECWNPNNTDPADFQCMNQNHQDISQNTLFCVPEEIKSYNDISDWLLRYPAQEQTAGSQQDTHMTDTHISVYRKSFCIMFLRKVKVVHTGKSGLSCLPTSHVIST